MALELAPFRMEEFTTWLFLRDLITEFLANYFLMFSAVIVSQLLNEDQGYTRLEVAFAIGAVILAIFETFAHFSCSVCPNFGILGILLKKMSPVRVLIYLIPQTFGCWAGTLTIKALLTDYGAERISSLHLPEGVQPWQGFVNEVIIQAIVTFVIVAANDSTRKPENQTVLVTTFCVVGVVLYGKISAPCLHPGIAIGLCLTTGDWTDHWPFVWGPVVGACFTPFLYVLLIYMETDDSTTSVDQPDTPPATETESAATPELSGLDSGTAHFRTIYGEKY